MSNLGFQTIYTLLNAEPGIVCERVFLPPKSEIAALRAAGTPIVTLESQTPVREFDVLAFSVSFEWDYTNVLTMMTLAGVPQRAACPNAPRSAGDDRRRRDLREPGTAGALRRCDCGRRGRGAGAAPRARLRDGERPRRAAAPAGCRARLLRAVLLRPALQRRQHDQGVRTQGGHRCSSRRAQGGAQDDRGGRSARDRHLHAGHRVRLAVAGGGCARLRQPVPVLLGRLQLPSRARLSEGADPAAGRGRAAALGPDRPGVDRPLRSPRHRGDSRTACRDGLQHQPGVAATRRSDAHPPAVAAQERRAHHHHRTGNRLRPSAPRDQQDGDQRRDPGRLRHDLRGRLREPRSCTT